MKSSNWVPALVFASALGVSMSACDRSGRARVGFEARDSAGIEIVESFTAALTGPAAWTIDPEPIVEIGAVDSDAPYLFTRIWDATRFPDGRIAVVDELSLEVRVFDQAGRHLNTFGAAGDGPQEFAGPPFIEASGANAMTAWDGGHLRLSWFATDGDLLEQVNMLPVLADLGVNAFRNGRVWEIDADGTLLSTGPVRPPRTEGLRDSFRRFTVFGDRGTTSYDLGTFVSGQSFVVRLERMSMGIGNPYAPFHAAGLAGGGRVAIGDGTQWEIRVLEPEGRVVRILRATIPRAPVTDDLLQQAEARTREIAETSPLTLAQAEDAFSQLPLADSVPAIGGIRTSGGRLWVGRRTGRWFELGDYDVFAEDGRWLTTVVMPPDIEWVHEIGEDYVLAHVTDELDVPFLRMYRIRRGG